MTTRVTRRSGGGERVTGRAIDETLSPSPWNSSTEPAPEPSTVYSPSRIELGGIVEKDLIVDVSALTIRRNAPSMDDGSVNVAWLVYDSPGCRKRGSPSLPISAVERTRYMTSARLPRSTSGKSVWSSEASRER